VARPTVALPSIAINLKEDPVATSSATEFAGAQVILGGTSSHFNPWMFIKFLFVLL